MAGVAKAPDRRPEGVDRCGAGCNQALGQYVVDMPKNEPFRSARGADERTEEIRMETLCTQSITGSRPCADD
jgi:hypothetical protein